MSTRSNWGHFFRAEAPLLRRFLSRFAPSVSADDLVQDSFERVSPIPLETVASPRGLLFRIARNLATDAMIREARTPVRRAGVRELEIACDSPDPEETAALREELRALEEALERLPRHKRVALVMFKVEGHSYKEIGKHLGVSPRTVERYVADAIAHCHRELRGFRED